VVHPRVEVEREGVHARGRLRGASVLALCALAGAVLPACTGGAKHEASALSDAVDRFRRATGAASTPAATEVAAVECTDAQVCEAKAACVAAIDPTARALALKDEVGARLADIEAARVTPDSPEAQALPGKLDDASRLLREGHEKMELCERRLTDLRIAYRL
jgi:hypothetical protein